MTRHAKPTRMLRPLNKRQWMKIAAVVAAAGLLGAAGLVSRSFYHADDVKPISTITSFSATDSAASPFCHSWRNQQRRQEHHVRYGED